MSDERQISKPMARELATNYGYKSQEKIHLREALKPLIGKGMFWKHWFATVLVHGKDCNIWITSDEKFFFRKNFIYIVFLNGYFQDKIALTLYFFDKEINPLFFVKE